jgi:hypothetical protein
MIISARIPVAVLLVTASSAALARSPHADDPAPRRTTLGGDPVNVPLEITSDEPRPRVVVTINGAGPFTCILDTGASVSILEAGMLARLGLEPRGTLFVGADLELRKDPDPSISAQATVEEVLLDEIGIGDARFETVPAVILERSAQSLPDGVSGLLGITVFAECLATIDYPAGELRLTKGSLPLADGEDILSFEWDEWLPEVPITIAGTQHPAHIDTGSPSGFVVPSSVAEGLAFQGEPVLVGRGRTLNAEFDISEATLRGDISVGAHVFEEPSVRIQGQLPFVNVGCAVLRELVVTFDQKTRRVRVARTSRPAPHDAGGVPRGDAARGPQVRVVAGGPPRLGLVAIPIPGGLEVRETLPGLPAEAAGLMPGDVVRRVNGKAVSDYEPAELRETLRALPLALVVERAGESIEIRVEAP